jgi:glucose-1-phosphate thymidylyltransferase
MKGVILAGGCGTRMRPATAVVNKHLLPVYSWQGANPMIFYPISTLVRSGAKDILIISSKEHSGSIIQNLGDGFQFGARFSYRIQDVNRVEMGIASALKLAQDFTCDEPFAVILGDNFFEDDFSKEFEEFCLGSGEEAKIFLKTVTDPERFGVYHNGSIEEKPKHPKSNMAVTGLYLYKRGVYEITDKLVPSRRGELEVTDINQNYCERNLMGLAQVEGFWSDMGTPASMCRTQEFINLTKHAVFVPPSK